MAFEIGQKVFFEESGDIATVKALPDGPGNNYTLEFPEVRAYDGAVEVPALTDDRIPTDELRALADHECPHCASTVFAESALRATAQRFGLSPDGDVTWDSFDWCDGTEVLGVECANCRKKVSIKDTNTGVKVSEYTDADKRTNVTLTATELALLTSTLDSLDKYDDETVVVLLQKLEMA